MNLAQGNLVNHPKSISEMTEGFAEGELVVYDNSGLPVSVSVAHTPTGKPPIALGEAILIAARQGGGKSLPTPCLTICLSLTRTILSKCINQWSRSG